jgi:hypothetical protein
MTSTNEIVLKVPGMFLWEAGVVDRWALLDHLDHLDRLDRLDLPDLPAPPAVGLLHLPMGFAIVHQASQACPMACAVEWYNLPVDPTQDHHARMEVVVVGKDYNQCGLASSVGAWVAHMVCSGMLQRVVLPNCWGSLYSRRKSRWYLGREFVEVNSLVEENMTLV